MRHIFVILILSLLLCGCSSPEPELSIEPTLPPVAAMPSATEETVPPDPMQRLLEVMTTEEKVGQLLTVDLLSRNSLLLLCLELIKASLMRIL